MDDERIMKRRIGAMVLIVLAISVVLIFLFADRNFQWRGEGTPLRMRFSNAPGVVVGTPLARSGVRIGRVSDVSLQKNGYVLVTAMLDPGKLVFDGDSAMVIKPLMGDSEICITSLLTPGLQPTPVSSDYVIEGMPYQDPMFFLSSIQGQVAGTLSSIEATSNEMRTAFASLNSIVGDNRETISGMIAEAKTTAQMLRTTMATINTLLEDPEGVNGIKDTLTQLPQLVAETRASVKTVSEKITDSLNKADGVITGADKALAGINNTVAGLDGKSGGILRQAELTMSRLNASLDNADRLLAEVQMTAEKINSGQGTIGMLVNDRTLYDQIANTTANLEQMTARLEPIIYDVRTFTDQLARRPADVVGPRALFSTSDGTKW